MGEELKIIITATDDVSPSATKAGKSLEGIGDSAKKSGQGLKDLNSAFEAVTGVSLAGAGAIALVGKGLSIALDEAGNAERQMAATEAVIRSTGGAAGMTAQDVIDLAGKLQNLTGVEDDTIQAGENMLLTFTGIGRNVFPQATEATMNMAVAMAAGNSANLDFTSTAIQVGKALNDPINGVTALRRVGVQLTDQQEEQIKQFVALGETEKAQQLILDELNREFGGLAESLGDTNVGKIDKFKAHLSDLAEAVGGKLLPILGDAADALNTMFTWEDKLTDVTLSHEEQVIKSSKTYQEYATEMGRVNSITREHGILGQKLAEQTKVLSEEEYSNKKATLEAAEAEQKHKESLAQAAAAEAAKTKMIEENEGVVTEAQDTQSKAMQKLQQDAADAAENIGQKYADLNDSRAKKVKDTYAEIARIQDDFNRDSKEKANELTASLNDAADKHAEHESDLKSRMVEEDDSYNARVLEDNQRLQEQLDTLAEQYANRQRDRQEQLNDLLDGFSQSSQDRADRLQETIDATEERLADRRENREEQLQDLQDELADKRQAKEEELSHWQQGETARTWQIRHDTAMAAFEKDAQAEIDALLKKQKRADEKDAEQAAKDEEKAKDKAAKEEARAQEENDKRLARLQEEIERENTEYEKQQIKLKADAEKKAEEDKLAHEKKLVDLQEQLTKENAEYEKQTGKLREESLKRKEQDTRSFADKFSALTQEIAQEDAAYAKQTATINKELAAQQDKYRDNLGKIEEAYSKAIDNIKKKLEDSGIPEEWLSLLTGGASARSSATASTPWWPSTYAEGGTVPGPVGSPQLAIIHGGETVIPVGGQSGGGFTFVYSPTFSAGDARELQEKIAPALNLWWEKAKRSRSN
jgi:hypothetical protein